MDHACFTSVVDLLFELIVQAAGQRLERQMGLADAAIALAARPAPPGEQLPTQSEIKSVTQAFSGPTKGGAPSKEEIARLVAAVKTPR